MAQEEIFESLSRSSEDKAGVFEYDGEVSYFYLYDNNKDNGNKILGAIKILSGDPDFAADDVSIQWDNAEEKVGLFIRGTVWAVFDVKRKESFGGDYSRWSRSSVPQKISDYF